MMEIPSFVEGEMFQCLAHLDEDMLDTPWSLVPFHPPSLSQMNWFFPVSETLGDMEGVYAHPTDASR